MPRAIRFETELNGGSALELAPDFASTRPSSGKATVIVLIDPDPEDAAWLTDAYEQFLSDDSEEEPGYDWHEFASRTYGSCASLGLEEPNDPPLTSPPQTSPGRR